MKEGERCKVRRRGKVLRKGSAHRDNRVINGENDDLLCSFLSLESRDGLRLKETIKTSVLQSLIPSICCSSSSSSLRFSDPDILDLHYSHLFFIYYTLKPGESQRRVRTRQMTTSAAMKEKSLAGDNLRSTCMARSGLWFE